MTYTLSDRFLAAYKSKDEHLRIHLELAEKYLRDNNLDLFFNILCDEPCSLEPLLPSENDKQAILSLKDHGLSFKEHYRVYMMALDCEHPIEFSKQYISYCKRYDAQQTKAEVDTSKASKSNSINYKTVVVTLAAIMTVRCPKYSEQILHAFELLISSPIEPKWFLVSVRNPKYCSDLANLVVKNQEQVQTILKCFDLVFRYFRKDQLVEGCFQIVSKYPKYIQEFCSLISYMIQNEKQKIAQQYQKCLNSRTPEEQSQLLNRAFSASLSQNISFLIAALTKIGTWSDIELQDFFEQSQGQSANYISTLAIAVNVLRNQRLSEPGKIRATLETKTNEHLVYFNFEQAFLTLQEAGLIKTKKYFEAILNANDSDGISIKGNVALTLAKSFVKLKEERLLESDKCFKAVIEKHSKSYDFARALVLLKNNQLLDDKNLIFLEQTEILYYERAKAMVALKKHNFGNNKLICSLFDKRELSLALPSLINKIAELHKAGILIDSELLEVIQSQNFLSSDYVIKSFLKLKSDGFDYKSYKRLYVLVAKAKEGFVDKAIELQKLGILNKPILYVWLLIHDSRFMDQFSSLFIALNEIGKESNPNLHVALEQYFESNCFFLESKDFDEVNNKTTQAVIKLYQDQISYDDFSEFYNELLKDHYNAQHCDIVTHILKKLKIAHNQYSNYLTKTLANNVSGLYRAVENLQKAGFNDTDHIFVFKHVFEQFSWSKGCKHRMNMLVNQLCAYANEHGLINEGENKDKQLEKIRQVLEHENTIEIVEGPINISSSTKEILKILKFIFCQPSKRKDNEQSQLDPIPEKEELLIAKSSKSAKIKYSDSGYYVLCLGDEREINLSMLIKNANLTHLVLDDKLLEGINKFLDENCDEYEILDGSSLESGPLGCLTKLHIKALEFYTGEGYRVINKIQRGERIRGEDEFNVSVHSDEHMMLFINFLYSIILTDAINKLRYHPEDMPIKKALNKIISHYKGKLLTKLKADPKEEVFRLFKEDGHEIIQNGIRLNEILTQSVNEDVISIEEKEAIDVNSLKLFFPDHAILDRREDLTVDDIALRIANTSWTFPALTSFTTDSRGADSFCEQSHITKLERTNNFHIISYKEDEIIFPQGTQLMTSVESGNKMVSQLVNSPMLEPKDRFFSDSAFAHAMSTYLTKQYTESDNDFVELNNQKIYRPNHNATDTYAGMLLLPYVIQYFAKHAKEEKFREYCAMISDSEVEWLLCGAAFRITGRKSEVGAKEDLKTYSSYKKDSADNFKEFVAQFFESTPEFNEQNTVMLERVAHVIEFYGDPNFENKPTKRKGDIAAISDEEHTQRIFLERILRLSHNLMLVRCFNLENCKQNIVETARNLSKLDDWQQEEDLNQLISYSISLRKAHGGSLRVDISANGELKDKEQDLNYEPSFAKVSTSLKALMDISQTVTRPELNRRDVSIRLK